MSWWMTGFAVMTVAALVALGLGLWLGYRWGLADRKAGDEFSVLPICSCGRPMPVILAKEGAPSTAELFAMLERDEVPIVKVGRPEVIVAEAPGRPSRATNFIEKLTADTDRWIAAMKEDAG